MNAKSLHPSFIKNQQSMIDDPFDLERRQKGVSRMTHEQALDSYIRILVADYSKFYGDRMNLTLSMIPPEEQKELAALYIESIDREIEWACYGFDESINSSFLCKLMSMLKNDHPMDKLDFAETVTKNILAYYEETLNEKLYTACDDYYIEAMNEAGYYQERDLEHGDMFWRKSR